MSWKPAYSNTNSSDSVSKGEMLTVVIRNQRSTFHMLIYDPLSNNWTKTDSLTIPAELNQGRDICHFQAFSMLESTFMVIYNESARKLFLYKLCETAMIYCGELKVSSNLTIPGIAAISGIAVCFAAGSLYFAFYIIKDSPTSDILGHGTHIFRYTFNDNQTLKLMESQPNFEPFIVDYTAESSQASNILDHVTDMWATSTHVWLFGRHGCDYHHQCVPKPDYEPLPYQLFEANALRMMPEGPSMNDLPRHSLAATTKGNTIYVVGEYAKRSSGGALVEPNQAKVAEYGFDHWKRLPNLTKTRNTKHLVTVGNWLVAIQECESTKESMGVERLNLNDVRSGWQECADMEPINGDIVGFGLLSEKI